MSDDENGRPPEDPESSSQKSNHIVPDGPVQIIETIEYEHVFNLDSDALRTILLESGVADLPVAIVSVAGAFRKGKSFLLNFFLRYLLHLEGSRRKTRLPNGGTKLDSPAAAGGSANDDWLGASDTKLDGFSWRGGCERETNGILLWHRPFVLTRPDGTEVAVLLMDTQGAFDSQSTVKDCATVFALSTMISSFQIYNLSQNIQEDDLQHLQLFTEYGRLAMEEADAKPFQTLMFLVRDWSFPYEAEYGFIGGQRILDRRLQTTVVRSDEQGNKVVCDKQHPELQQLRQHIRSCFDTISCFLMPHPGLKVATSPAFVGQLTLVEDEFKQNLRVLVPKILAPENLVVKEINGQSLTCRGLLFYFEAYTKIFQGEDLPEPKSMLMATAEANNLAAVAESKKLYNSAMDGACGGHTPYMAPEDLEQLHEQTRLDALNLFKLTKKMGGDPFSSKFLEDLDEQIMDAYNQWVKTNESKNLFRSMRTPAVMFVFMIVTYVFHEVFELIGLDVFMHLSSLLIWALMIFIGIWTYARYSGNYREVSAWLDKFCEDAWQNVGFHPLSQIKTLLKPASRQGFTKALEIHRKISEHPAARSAMSELQPHASSSRSSAASSGGAAKKYSAAPAGAASMRYRKQSHLRAEE